VNLGRWRLLGDEVGFRVTDDRPPAAVRVGRGTRGELTLEVRIRRPYGLREAPRTTFRCAFTVRELVRATLPRGGVTRLEKAFPWPSTRGAGSAPAHDGARCEVVARRGFAFLKVSGPGGRCFGARGHEMASHVEIRRVGALHAPWGHEQRLGVWRYSCVGAWPNGFCRHRSGNARNWSEIQEIWQLGA
jgi:hypothetical protein